MDERFQRTEMLIGKDAMERLSRARCAVFGLGGVGGFAAEALARSGVGALDLIDFDTVDITNINRQIIADDTTVGRKKTGVFAERLSRIAPELRLTLHDCFYLPANADGIDLSAFDYVVDAVDTVSAKIALIERAKAAGTPVISSMGTAGKLDPSRLRITDIFRTANDPLARVMRRELRKRGITELAVVCSDEPPREGPLSADGRRKPGSSAFVPPAAGLLLASRVVRDLCGPGF